MMSRPLLVTAGVALVAFVASGVWLTVPRPVLPAGSTALEAGGDAERGRQVFLAGGCASCHMRPGQEDRLNLGGGLELKTAFGSFFVPNISPDPEDGIGRWSVADLVNALQAGVSPSGQHYYPALPYTSYAHARVDDLRDLMAFLRTLPAVSGKSPPHRLKFPFDQRRLLGFWKLLYLDRSPITADPAHDATWNRGHYLTEALGHCAECHSGRDMLGGIETKYRFAGGPAADGKDWVPNITQDKDGIADYSASDIVEVLTTGNTPDGDSVGGSMVEVVRNTSQLTEEDRAAIATYIKSLKPRSSPPKPTKTD